MIYDSVIDAPPPTNQEFFEFRRQYQEVLKKFLANENISEDILHKAYKLGRKAILQHLSMLSITAIHDDALIDELQKLESSAHLAIADKASIFLEEVLAPFAMITKEFREAIHLINKRSIEYALRVRSLQEEISHRKRIESDLRESEERHRLMSEVLQASLTEKEALLKEIYHRVKNNLQVVMSLLNLQIESVTDAITKKVLIDSVTRVKSMALVHEMLYQSQNLAKIEMSGYIRKLFEYLCHIYETEFRNEDFNIEIDDISLPIDVAIPLGLIVNELLSNCFKHAFPPGKMGTINVSLTKQNDHIILIVSDNGQGIPADTSELKSLGMRLIHNLTNQLSGKIELEVENGTTFIITI